MVSKTAAGDAHQAEFAPRDGVDGVADQIVDRLLELDAIRQHMIANVAHIDANHHPCVHADQVEEGAQVFDHRGDALVREFAGAGRDEFAHAANDVAGPNELGLGQIQGAAGAVAQRPRPGDVGLACMQIDRGGRQGLVQFVRQSRRHFAHGVQPPALAELVHQVAHALIGGRGLPLVAEGQHHPLGIHARGKKAGVDRHGDDLSVRPPRQPGSGRRKGQRGALDHGGERGRVKIGGEGAEGAR